MIVLLVLTLATIVAGSYLMIDMFRRDEPAVGMIGLMVLQAAGIMGSVYGVISHVE